MNESKVDDVLMPTPLDRLRRWFGPARSYVLTRWLVLRLLGVVYLFAFLGIVFQGLPLLGEHGLTPVHTYVERLHAANMTFWDVPSLFMLDASDAALRGWAIVGVVLSAALLLGYANLPSMLVLWVIYGSYERVGQTWWGFGWEIQLLETTLLAACLVHLWDPRPVKAPAPHGLAIVLMRWLVFRIMLGAGLIKLRGDACWTELTCLDAHFETQPIPNPLSPFFHHLPHVVLATGVLFNHVVEVVLPWFVFGPRFLRLVAAVGMASFQIVLIASGNLAFLNWLTLIPVLAVFDDDFLIWLVPKRFRERLKAKRSVRPQDGKQLALAFGIALLAVILWQPFYSSHAASTEVILGIIAIGGATCAALYWRDKLVSAGHRLDGQLLLIAAFAALVMVKSCTVIGNLASSKHQLMNSSFDRLALVNTYGAFGSVDMVRHELVIEGTMDADIDHAEWRAYELPCKPGDLHRRPCLLGPYHRRLDWLIWFSAMEDEPRDPWLLHLVWKLLDGDSTIRQLIAVDPFDGKAPRFVRIRRFVYHLEPYSSDTWWTRDSEELWLPPIARDSPGFLETLGEYGMPSPSTY